MNELLTQLTNKRFGAITINYQNDTLQGKNYWGIVIVAASRFVIEFLFTYRYFTASEDGKLTPAQELLSRLAAFYPVNTPGIDFYS